MKTPLVVAGLIAAIAVSVFAIVRPINIEVTAPAVTAGAVSGPDHYEKHFFYDDIIVGGNVLATSSQGTATYTAANITNSKLIIHTATAALTVTLPASSTLSSFIPRAGDTATMFISPVTTLITFAGGTGTDLNTASSTKNINAAGLGRLDFVRKSNTDIEVLLTPGI